MCQEMKDKTKQDNHPKKPYKTNIPTNKTPQTQQKQVLEVLRVSIQLLYKLCGTNILNNQ